MNFLFFHLLVYLISFLNSIDCILMRLFVTFKPAVRSFLQCLSPLYFYGSETDFFMHIMKLLIYSLHQHLSIFSSSFFLIDTPSCPFFHWQRHELRCNYMTIDACTISPVFYSFYFTKTIIKTDLRKKKNERRTRTYHINC